MRKNIFYILSLLLVASCGTSKKITNVKTATNQSISSELTENPDIKNFIAPFKNQLEKEMNTVISHTEFDLTKSGNNSNLGQLLSDITKDAAQNWADKNVDYNIDAAILNVGGIRNGISKGDIKVNNIFEVMPFDNELAIVRMSADDVQEIFNYYLKYKKNNPVSGLEISIKNNQIEKALIGGKTPEKGKYYYIATSDYLVGGGDNMMFFKKGTSQKTNLKLRDVFIEAFKKMPEINVKNENRLSFDNNNNE